MHRGSRRTSPIARPKTHDAAMNDPFDRSFRDRTLAGETLIGLFLDLGSPAAAEVCAAAAYDWLLVDLEHGAATEADLPGLLRAVEPVETHPVTQGIIGIALLDHIIFNRTGYFSFLEQGRLE